MTRTEELINQLKGNVEAEELFRVTESQEQLKSLPPYKETLKALNFFLENFTSPKLSLETQGPQIIIGNPIEIDDQNLQLILKTAKQLIPWKKGPFNLCGEVIDAEWRSDLKWKRIEKSVGPLEGKSVLDIGCNNGYFMYKLLSHSPQLVLGIDPVVPNWAQFSFLQHMARDPRLFFELWGVEHLPLMKKTFDLILSMGIIYHHRNPIEQLIEKRMALKPGGEIIIETIAIPGKESISLFPEGRYAKMRNVWFVPTSNCLYNWLKKARFRDIELIEESHLTSNEQRLTKWCPPPRESLENFLNPENSNLTIEGHPAPIRVAFKAKRHKDDKQ